MSKLVKFDCGCIGLTPDNSNSNEAWVFRFCDYGTSWGNEFGCAKRTMTSLNKGQEVPKDYSYLSPDKEEKFFNEISSLIADGYKFREIKSLLS